MTEQAKSFTVELARTVVQESGQLVAIEGPHYLSPDGEWLSYMLPGVYESGHPDVARIIIERQGQKPREVVVSWADYEKQEQSDPAWNETRAEKPMTIFGSEVERHGYRVVFPDLLAPLLEGISAAKALAASGESDEGDAWEPARDWFAEIAAATSVVEADEVYRASRDKGRTAELEVQWMARRRVLTAGPGVEAATVPAAEAAVMPGVVPHPPAVNVARLTDPVRKGRRS